MVCSFVTGGTLDLVPALAVMLGANVGTTLVVQVLSFNIAVVTPILLMAGVIAFRRGASTRTRDLGRVLIGIGLMLLALHIFLGALVTTESAVVSQALLGAIANQPILCLAIAAAVTWAAHSSVAVVLVVMSLGAAHLVSPAAELALVLGANVGSALNPLLETSQAGNPASRRLPVGNLLTRIVGCALVLPFLRPIADALESFEPNPARLAADFHTAFNVLLALLFIGPLDFVAALLTRWLPDQPRAADPGTPVYLDASRRRRPRGRAGLGGAGGAAHGRPDRDHAAAGDDRAPDQRPQARFRDQPHGRLGRQPERGGENVRDAHDARQPG